MVAYGWLDWAGAPVRSHFGGEAYWGEVTEVRPLPSPAQPDGSTTLWHVRYEDGDEEELNERDVRRAAADASRALRPSGRAGTCAGPAGEGGRRCATCIWAGATSAPHARAMRVARRSIKGAESLPDASSSSI